MMAGAATDSRMTSVRTANSPLRCGPNFRCMATSGTMPRIGMTADAAIHSHQVAMVAGRVCSAC